MATLRKLSRNASRLRSLSYCWQMRWKRSRMEVWFASMRPETRWGVLTYGERRESATWIEAGPHGMNEHSWRSRIRCSDLCTCVGSTSPWMISRMEM